MPSRRARPDEGLVQGGHLRRVVLPEEGEERAGQGLGAFLHHPTVAPLPVLEGLNALKLAHFCVLGLHGRLLKG